MSDLPPQHIVDLAVEVSCQSPCRSKRGVVVFHDDHVVSNGYNFKPRGFDCDGSDACKAACRREAIHAEQMALLSFSAAFGRSSRDLLHVKTVDGRLVASGGPSCVECSKLILACGIAGVWLFHENGWRRYDAAEFHRLSLESAESALAELRQALIAARQFLDPDIDRGPSSDGWLNTVELVAAALAAPARQSEAQ